MRADFTKPDFFSKLVSINSKMTEMNTRIEELSDDIEVYCKRKPRIGVLKLITDIDAITPRLYSIITNKADPAFSNLDYKMSHTTLGGQYLFGNNNKVITPSTPDELQKSLAEIERQFQFQQGLKYADALYCLIFYLA
jgi:hypothetical protein